MAAMSPRRPAVRPLLRLLSTRTSATIRPAGLAVLLALAGGAGLAAQSAERDPEHDPGREPARLLVLVAVDQLIPEQLERLRPWLDGGLGRFVREGQVWRRAEHQHACTETGPGHATLGTGVHPSRHGIVGNGWWTAESSAYCCGDPDARLVTASGVAAKAGSASACQLLVPGIADHLRAAHPGSLSVGISVKDRSAILSLGRRATWALWWDREGRGFVTSDAYGTELPAWVVDWNERWTEGLDASAAPGGHVWEAGLPPGFAASGTAPDARPGEAAPHGGTSFPHRLPPLEGTPPDPAALARLARAVTISPLGDRFVVELAARAVEALALGADEAPDLLFVGLSACDMVGHCFGPSSQEVASVLLAADDALGELFLLLDRRVGRGRWVAALSSDHGVLELPETLAERGVDARRVSSADLTRALGEVRREVAEAFGADFHRRTSGDGVLLDRAALADSGVDAAAVRRAYAQGMLARVPWLARAYTADELAAPLADVRADPLHAVTRRSFLAGRSPDVVFLPRPWTLLDSATGTGHGSPYPYDRDVPLVFLGPGSPAQTRHEPCGTVDLLPTLLHRAGVPVPEGLDGRVLEGGDPR